MGETHTTTCRGRVHIETFGNQCVTPMGSSWIRICCTQPHRASGMEQTTTVKRLRRVVCLLVWVQFYNTFMLSCFCAVFFSSSAFHSKKILSVQGLIRSGKHQPSEWDGKQGGSESGNGEGKKVFIPNSALFLYEHTIKSFLYFTPKSSHSICRTFTRWNHFLNGKVRPRYLRWFAYPEFVWVRVSVEGLFFRTFSVRFHLLS